MLKGYLDSVIPVSGAWLDWIVGLSVYGRNRMTGGGRALLCCKAVRLGLSGTLGSSDPPHRSFCWPCPACKADEGMLKGSVLNVSSSTSSLRIVCTYIHLMNHCHRV